MRRFSMMMFAAIACASAGCIVNAAPEEGAPSATTPERTTESAPVPPVAQQPQTNVVAPVPAATTLTTMDESKPDPAPPRPWEPHPGAVPSGLDDPNETTQPKMGGAKDDGTKPTK